MAAPCVASRNLFTCCRPHCVRPPVRCCPRKPHAGAWLTAIPSDPHTSLAGRHADSTRAPSCTHLVTNPWVPSRGRGAESPVKPLVRKRMWCPSNGSHTPPCLASLQMTAVGSTVWFMGRSHLLRWHAALSEWYSTCWGLFSGWGRVASGRASQTSHPPRTRPRGRSVPLRARM